MCRQFQPSAAPRLASHRLNSYIQQAEKSQERLMHNQTRRNARLRRDFIMHVYWEIVGRSIQPIPGVAEGTLSGMNDLTPNNPPSVEEIKQFLRVVMAPAIVRALREGPEFHQEPEGERK